MRENNFKKSRRKFLADIGFLTIGLPAVSALADIGCKFNKQNAEDSVKKNKAMNKLGVALVGLGSYATNQLAPALQETEHCYLAGIVTGTPSKIDRWKNNYSIPDKNIYNYQDFDKLKNNPDIDIIYVVLPNSMHAEFTIRAAQAGKHVICEKPMAMTVEECDQMIAACKKANRLLSIGYRLHFEPYNLEMVRLGTQKIYGNITKMSAGFGFPIGDPTQWRLKKSMSGGGPLVDVGVYCIQGFCYTTGLEPIAVTAKESPKTNTEKFKDVEQSLSWQFEMPNNIICQGQSSYGDGMNFLKAEAEKGIFQLTSAYGYNGQSGNSPAGEMNFAHINQQAKQMDGFALSIKNNQPSIVPGEMGRRDVKLIRAIYKAMETGRKVMIS